jgi:hypothetical protein
MPLMGARPVDTDVIEEADTRISVGLLTEENDDPEGGLRH